MPAQLKIPTTHDQIWCVSSPGAPNTSRAVVEALPSRTWRAPKAVGKQTATVIGRQNGVRAVSEGHGRTTARTAKTCKARQEGRGKDNHVSVYKQLMIPGKKVGVPWELGNLSGGSGAGAWGCIADRCEGSGSAAPHDSMFV